MSVDPFANTTTVKNILQHIISPKIVSDGSGGYITKTDLVNVDNIIFQSSSTTPGTSLLPLRTQSGQFTFAANSSNMNVYHENVTTSSIVLATVLRTDPGINQYIVQVVPSAGSFAVTISNNSGNPSILKIGWFIASF
jgi:hypothetical protein